MNSIEIINQVIVIFGIPTLVGSAIWLGRKLEVIDRIEKSIDSEVRPDLKEVRERFFILEGKLQNLP